MNGDDIKLEKTIDFSISKEYETFGCKKCNLEFLLFSVVRPSEEDVTNNDIIIGPLVNDLHCPMCGEK